MKFLYSTILFASVILPNMLKAQYNIIGKWISANQDLIVEVYQKDKYYYGKIVWFACYTSKPMASYLDVHNPNPKLRTRTWLGMNSLVNLLQESNTKYTDGKIYDVNSGRTYGASVKFSKPNQIIVRGYFGIELIGKSLTFNRYTGALPNVARLK
jgi:uncharacterized protein (DUF2147 family)